MYPVFFELPNPFGAGKLTLYWYGTWWVIGFLLGLVWFARRGRTQLGLASEQVVAFAVLVVVAGVVGSKLLSVITYADAFVRSPIQVLLSREKWSVVGGLLGGSVVGWMLTRHHAEISVAYIADVVAPPLLLGQALGRQGCFAVGCCYGRPTHGWWGVRFDHPLSVAPHGVPVIPTQQLEFALDVVLLLALLFFEARAERRRVGQLFAIYVLGYGVIRFGIEFLRGDSQRLFAGLSTNQWAVLLVIALTAIIYRRIAVRGQLAREAYHDPPRRQLFAVEGRS